MKRFLAVCLSLLTVFLLAACGGKASSAPMPSPEAPGYEGVEMPSSDMGWYDHESVEPSGAAKSPQSVKMIYSASIDLETMEFDKALEDISTLTETLSGYFEERNISGFSSDYRYASLIVRVPAASFDSFCTKVGDVCHMLRLNSAQENVSQAYYDVDSRLTTAKTKLERLQELLSKAENMADIITIEDAISETEQVIDNLSGTLRGYDNLVDYSTVRITISEVYRYSGTKDAPQTLGDKLGNAFTSGLESVGEFFENLVVFLAYSWLWLLMLAAVVVVIVVLIRRANKRSRAKLAAKLNSNSRPE